MVTVSRSTWAVHSGDTPGLAGDRNDHPRVAVVVSHDVDGAVGIPQDYVLAIVSMG